MSEDMRATEGVLKESATIVNTTKGALDGHLKALTGDVETILAPNWDGSGWGAFGALMTAWNTQAGRVTNALVGLEEALLATDKKFTAQENIVQAAFNKFQSIIPTN